MKLHRVGNQADWTSDSGSAQNSWQRLAVQTDGVVTPGNMLTIAGLVLVCIGAWMLFIDQFLAAFICVAIGRFFDIADGWAAEKTKTKSPLGESLDAGFDKIATLVILVAFAVAEIAPLWLLGLLLLPHIIIAVISGIAMTKQRRLHPSRLGKASTAVAWLGLICFIGHAIEPDAFLKLIAYGCSFVAIALGLVAATEYFRSKNPKTKLADPSA